MGIVLCILTIIACFTYLACTNRAARVDAIRRERLARFSWSAADRAAYREWMNR